METFEEMDLETIEQMDMEIKKRIAAAAQSCFFAAKLCDLKLDTKKGMDYIKQAVELDPSRKKEFEDYKFIRPL